MVQDRLNKAVMQRLKELGVPEAVIEVGEFRRRFFCEGWIMLVRDGDDVADVHLIEPQPAPAGVQRPPQVIAQSHPATDSRHGISGGC